MCLAVPMRLRERRDFLGVVEAEGVEREVSLILYPDACEGDYLLIHAGYAIGQVDEEEARETLALLRRMAEDEEPA